MLVAAVYMVFGMALLSMAFNLLQVFKKIFYFISLILPQMY